MSDTETYVRIRSADDLTVHRPQYVYEGVCPVHSIKDRYGACHHGPDCSGTGPDCGPGEYEVRVICQLTSNVNESIIWCDDDCREMQEWTQLRKSFQGQGVRYATVWHDTDTPNLTTGRVETDPRKFATHLREQSEIMGERLGQVVEYEPVDMTDRDALGVTDEGMDATHDAQVRAGVKDSRGRFVWTV